MKGAIVLVLRLIIALATLILSIINLNDTAYEIAVYSKRKKVAK